MSHHQELLKWFNGLYSRTLDLVGDYAGDELFIIEGDSLLLHCLSDDKLDFSTGFQLLHATYLVERFLAQLHQRKCNFHIIFFARHARACVPPHATADSKQKYLVAREAIFQHLSRHLTDSASSIQVHSFDTFDSSNFKTYLASVGVYFLMCHDGAFSRLGLLDEGVKADEDVKDAILDEDDSDDSSISDPIIASHSSEVWSTSILFREMIHWFVSNGYNVALISMLECRDTKVMATILEGSARAAKNIFGTSEDDLENFEDDSAADTRQSTGSTSSNSNTGPPNTVDEILPDLITIMVEAGLRLSKREMAMLLTIGTMFRSGYSGEDDILPARAVVLHVVVMSECRLHERSTNAVSSNRGSSFLVRFVNILYHVITSRHWQGSVRKAISPCNVADMLDGRLFLQIFDLLAHGDGYLHLSSSILNRFSQLASFVKGICGVDLQWEPSAETFAVGHERTQFSNSIHGNNTSQSQSMETLETSLNSLSTVLPFSNPVVSYHLAPISITVEESSDRELGSGMSRTFQELTHWHNHKRPLNNKIKIPLTIRQLSFLNRRDQRFMAEIRDYAASLTNPRGGTLEPESVFVKSASNRDGKPVRTTPSSLPKKQVPAKQGAAQPSNKSKPGTSNVRAQAEARQRSKRAENHEAYLNAWKNMVNTFQNEANHIKRYIQVNQYLKGLLNDRREVVEPEILVYLMDILIRLWLDECKSNRKANSLHIAALIWHTILQIQKKQVVTENIAKCVNDTIRTLNLPAISVPCEGKRPLSFSFVSLSSSKTNLSIEFSPIDFQLTHAGPYLDRSMGSAPDPRVHDFEPDQWQREILDQIDAKKSLFVVAPTSAGKTFISFYAMKQILEESDDGILVYVAPTKALVNQIAAEVQARFSKKFSHDAGKSVWAIHTRDYRINNSAGCQILITVPHILQIMLLAPSNAESWSSRVRRIIFDEIHSIGQAQDGVVWEQLLLLAPCPIIALSATVGNPQAFSNWLTLTQEANGNELKMIQHKTRYSDLRKYVYNPPVEFAFNGLSAPTQLASLGLDDSPNMTFMHPVASLIDRSRGIPDDLTLEPHDCLELWRLMEKHKTDGFPVESDLNPANALPKIIVKSDVIRWEAHLKSALSSWMKDPKSPFDNVLSELSGNLHNRIQPPLQVSSTEGPGSDTVRTVRASSLLDTTLPLICSVHEQGALPAILFNYDRSQCEKLCEHLLAELQEAEKRWKLSSPTWKKKIAGWEAWKKAEDKRVKTKTKTKTKKSKKSSKDEDEPMSKMERLQEAASGESSLYESFDPDEPVAGFHLADMKCLSRSKFDAYVKEMRRRSIPEWLIDGLKRGIGVHHSGMNRKYRQMCEILFRKGYLRVVIATGTLALGINMPCKTVVFTGDSVFLTALGFRQAAGRAGRRGFDFLGNVVFQGISYPKVCRLLSSKLPDLNGHFPVTTSLVLRLLILLTESGHSSFAVQAVNSILSSPRIYLSGPEAKHTVLHHLRFSIEYLRRNQLLDRSGSPLNFAGTISHLYYTENSSFAFHALLSRGYFHELCEDVHHSPEVVTRTLMLVMAHIFGRRYLPRKTIEHHKSDGKHLPSVVFLPNLPKAAAKAIRAHNKSTLDIYTTYVTTFIKQHIKDPDCTLPLTGLKQGGDRSPADLCPSLPVLPPTLVNSSFVALSGHRDTWSSISELCKMVRGGVWLEQSIVPYVPIDPEDSHAPLNAYLYDFFRHGNVHALEHGNMVRKGDIWFVLNDFSLVLATIVTSFENFFKLAPNTDPDILDTRGCGDAYDDELDSEDIEAGNLTPENSSSSHQQMTHGRGRSANASGNSAPIKPTKSKIPESWDDELSDEETSDNLEQGFHSSNSPSGSSVPNSGTGDSHSQNGVLEEQRLLKVLKGFRLLQAEFNDKFRAMWA
ncbi:putative DEAD/DEAH box helicase [Aspergillus affinis]|uniref:putative DEAD/DEAH box helicase n=1 Tax=Aspergillus affinis TaxID=1070780 RepID=UPI0022FE85C4|nr:DEAD/DEAH box helicase [Aspergillus affinis]KAI9039192.1 DEAD/DEAH box helicase [Aspergillus affinis]